MQFRSALALGLAIVAATPALAQRGPGGWDGPGWGEGRYERGGWQSRNSRSTDREGMVEVTRFVAEGAAADALGHGPVMVRAAAVEAADRAPTDDRERATYEAAVIDQLAQAGYQTAEMAPNGGQVAELRIVHDIVLPEETPHKPISGEMSVGVSNRGSGVGLGLHIDLSKPRKALVGTRLELRIRDRASDAVLWEGRADIATREGSTRWTDQAIAAKLAKALFDKFPGR